jgi:hypothetical protein
MAGKSTSGNSSVTLMYKNDEIYNLIQAINVGGQHRRVALRQGKVILATDIPQSWAGRGMRPANEGKLLILYCFRFFER